MLDFSVSGKDGTLPAGVTPIWKRLGDGCNPNRDTLMELERAGFESVNHERITAPLPVVSPQIVGVATKASIMASG